MMSADWISAIERARKFDDLLLDGEDAGSCFKRLAKECHPDLHPGNKRADEAFRKLTELHDGDKPKELQIGRWTIGKSLIAGDVSNLYLTKQDSVFKIVRNKSDNDLMDRESKALKKIFPGHTQFGQYVPELLDSFAASGRRVNVIPYYSQFVSLEDISKKLGGVWFRHTVWMMNRLLSCLGMVQRLGLVHGAVVPSHILYNPATHDMKLVDWCYSTEIHKNVPAAVARYKSLYAPEILAKKSAGASTDIYMAAATLRSVSREIPKRFVPLFDWCLAGSPSSRVDDAWKFQDRWRDAAEREYGKPRFIEFKLEEKGVS